MKKKTLFVLLLISSAVVYFLFAQDDFEAWQKKQMQQFSDYKSAQDKAFVEFLEKNWEPYKTFTGEKLDDTPKPVEVPVAEEKEVIDFPQENIVEEVLVPQIEEPEEKHTMIVAVDKTAPVIDMKFWGLPLSYNYQPKTGITLNPLDEKAVANFWYVTSNTDYEILLKQLQESKEKMNLNDWGYCLLLNELGKTISGNDTNLSRLFIWFMLTKSGYECKVGYGEGSIFLLIPSANKIYGVTFVEMDGKRYYAIMFDKKQKLDFAINTYDGKYPNADALIDLSIKETPRIKKTILERELVFKYDGIEYKIPVQYDQSAAEFFKDYPQTNLDVYFQAPLSPEATQSLVLGFKPILEGRSETEAANMLLRFVQTAFQYKTDDEQFGREKSFFADESLFYPYNDCEDRSIIFSFLIRQILDRKVIGLDYPGHVATGVHFISPVNGDHVMVDEIKYIVCDPTYINADLGMAMPEFKTVQPKVISLSDN